KEEYEAKIRELSEREPEDKGKAELSAAEKEELMMLRRRISAENDPEIKEKFDAQIADNLDTVKETIMGVRWNAEDRERLEKIGDFEEFARSNPRRFKVILDAVEEVNPVEADIIRSKIADNASLRRGKQRTIKELSEKANEWFEKQNEESQK